MPAQTVVPRGTKGQGIVLWSSGRKSLLFDAIRVDTTIRLPIGQGLVRIPIPLGCGSMSIILVILFTCGGNNETQELDSSEYSNFVRSEGQATQRRIEKIFDEVGINAHFLFYPANEADPVMGKIARDHIATLSKAELRPICTRVRAELERFDNATVEGLAGYVFSPRETLGSPTEPHRRRYSTLGRDKVV